MNNLKKRKHLIRKLFKEVAKETVGSYSSLKLRIIDKRNYSTCIAYYNGDINILLGLNGVEKRVKYGYPNDYYINRPERLNKYIIRNRHNALRFVLYHELRHAWQRINDIYLNDEYDADTWALAHIKARPDQTRKPVKTFIPKATEYIRLYNLKYTTSEIARLCKVKDPRIIRYYLTKAGISLRRNI